MGVSSLKRRQVHALDTAGGEVGDIQHAARFVDRQIGGLAANGNPYPEGGGLRDARRAPAQDSESN